MNKKTKRLIFIILIFIVVSASFIMARFAGVSAGGQTSGVGVATEDIAATDQQTIEYASSGSVYWALLKLIAALAVVIGGIYGFIYLLRRMMGQKISGRNRDGLIEVMETAYLGPKKSVSLVRFSDRAVLIGSGNDHISVLAELSQEETTKLLARKEIVKNTIGFKTVFTDARHRLLKLKEDVSGRTGTSGNKPQAA
jgi:flagellar biosynthetic protein FliO